VKTLCQDWFARYDSSLYAGDRMKRFVEGTDRGQSTLSAASLWSGAGQAGEWTARAANDRNDNPLHLNDF
jgi:hypothetical protein